MTIPTGANKLVGKIAEQGLKEGAGKQQEASVNDQARFQDALKNNPQHDTGQTAQPQASVQPEHGVDKIQPVQRRSLGDSVLQGIEKMRSEAQVVGNQVESADGMASMTPQELLQAQMRISRVMFDEQLTGQVTGKLEQDMDTVMKSQ